eukprot:6174557-Prymnesium_polylepis.1
MQRSLEPSVVMQVQRRVRRAILNLRLSAQAGQRLRRVLSLELSGRLDDVGALFGRQERLVDDAGHSFGCAPCRVLTRRVSGRCLYIAIPVSSGRRDSLGRLVRGC